MRTATRQELLFKKAIEEAVKGNIQAAELILKFRMSAHRFGNIGGNYLEIIDWLPDYGGQTAEQKTQGFASKTDGNAVEWWVKPGDDFTNE
jgi:hypothetical protein